jgi:Winged helix-turn helix
LRIRSVIQRRRRCGHETSKSTIYKLLARHGWRKLMPRPFHPKRDIAAQNAFRKIAFQMP